jgi:AraC-like DNA-binding protein
MNVQIREYKPHSLLQDHILCYWEGSFLPGNELLTQTVVPGGYIDLVVHLSDAYCQLVTNNEWQTSPVYTCIGLWDKAYQVRFPHHVSTFGIRFYPESVEQFFKVPVRLFINSAIDSSLFSNQPLTGICHKVREATSTKERIAILNDFLLKQVNTQEDTFSYIAKAAKIIRQGADNLTIEDISRKSFISRRQLERGFKKRIGLSPKLYMRISRLNKVQEAFSGNQEENLTKLSYTLGYADQAHFTRDFKQFTGRTPGQYVNQKDNYLNFMDAIGR